MALLAPEPAAAADPVDAREAVLVMPTKKSDCPTVALP
jgi:hypothetical protein